LADAFVGCVQAEESGQFWADGHAKILASRNVRVKSGYSCST
jgi:hypothetical protein